MPNCSLAVYVHPKREVLRELTQTVFKTFAECGLQYQGAYSWHLTDEQKIKFNVPKEKHGIVSISMERIIDEFVLFGEDHIGTHVTKKDYISSLSAVFHCDFEPTSKDGTIYDEEKEVALYYIYKTDVKYKTRLCLFFYCNDDNILWDGEKIDAMQRNNKKIVSVLETLFVNTDAYFGYLARDLAEKVDVTYDELFDNTSYYKYREWNEIVLIGKELMPIIDRERLAKAQKNSVRRDTANGGLIVQQLFPADEDSDFTDNVGIVI